MSAFIVSKQQIDVLVAAGIKVACEDTDRVSPERCSELGQKLLDECVRSVSYRYSDSDLGDLPGTFQSETIPGTSETIEYGEWLTPYRYHQPAEIFREIVADEIGCYEYQSCEHPEWEDSFARHYCVGLRASLTEIPPAPQPEPEPQLDSAELERLYGDLSRDETIRRIRTALKRRSGKAWSVTGGRGTGWGWIRIDAPPKRRTGKHVQKPGAKFGEYEHIDTGVPQEFGIMTPQDCAELAQLLGKDRVHHQGESIPSGSDYYREYIDRAEGREVRAYGKQYWD